MKKFLGLLLAVLIFYSFAPCILVFASGDSADSKGTLNFNLTCGGKNEVSKESGDIITITYTLENATNKDSAYDISSLTNEIYYDHEFFELVEGSSKVQSGLNLTTKLAVYSWGEHRVFFNGFEIPAKQYAAKQVIGTFQLRIIASEGSSTIRSLGTVAAGKTESYNITTTDLSVRIGEADITPIYELSFDTNGGNTIFAVKKEEGTVIDLSAYKPIKSNCTFDGWYGDEELTTPIQSVELNGNMTVYAKWIENEAPGDKIYYKLFFETNGGSIIPYENIESGTVIDLSVYIPANENYTFVGWYSNRELTEAVQSVELNSDMTVYAKWAESESAVPGDTPPENNDPPATDENEPDKEDPDCAWDHPTMIYLRERPWLWILIPFVLIILFIIMLFSRDM